MAKTIGRFDYLIRAPKKRRGTPFMPDNAKVHVVLKNYSKDERGCPLVSPELMSEGEIDEYVQACKQDLDHVGRRAKRALRSANQKTLELTRAQITARKDGGE